MTNPYSKSQAGDDNAVPPAGQQHGSHQLQGGYPQGGYPQGGYAQGGYPPAPAYSAYPQQGGYPPPPGYGGYPVQQSNGIATAGMVCGIIGLVLFWFPIVGMVLAVLGIIFGGVGLARANKGAPNKGFAIAGLVCGAVAVVLYAVVILIALS